MELEDYGTESDDSSSDGSAEDHDDATTNYTTARTSEIFRIVDPTYGGKSRENTREQLIAEQEEYMTSRALTLAGRTKTVSFERHWTKMSRANSHEKAKLIFNFSLTFFSKLYY